MVVAGRVSGSDQFLPLRQDFVHSSQLGRLLRFRFGHYELYQACSEHYHDERNRHRKSSTHCIQ